MRPVASPDLLSPCPCGTGVAFGSCCRPLHLGGRAVTAEQLMRSRYAAYVVGSPDHLFRTWHPRTRPPQVTAARDLTWTGLRVLRTTGGGQEDVVGTVEFEARWTRSDGDGTLHEVSRFERRRGTWVYVDGD